MRPPVEVPKSDAKVVFVLPAGAGAMRVILSVWEHLQADLGGVEFSELAASVGGVSSGSLAAAGLLNRSPAVLKRELGGLVKRVFAVENKLIENLVRKYNFTLLEMEAICYAIASNPPNLSSPESAFASLLQSLQSAAVKQPSLVKKIRDQGGPAAILRHLERQNFFAQMVNADRAQWLDDILTDMFANSTMEDVSNRKLIAIATEKETRKPVFFAHPSARSAIPGPLAVSSTRLADALIASSAIPGFIKAPSTIYFQAPGEAEPRLISKLIDGFFANGVGFDPSTILYDIFSNQFPKDDLFIVYINNGAPIDWAFRLKHPLNNDGVHQEKENGRTVTFVALDSAITDEKGNSLFYLSGFYANNQIFKYMDESASRVLESTSYAWLKNALQRRREN